MRTTIDLPDKLMKQAKMKAIKEGKSLKAYFSEVLQNDLTSGSSQSHGTPPWKKLQSTGNTSGLNPEDSGFEGYSGPDWEHAMQVNDPDTPHTS